MVKKLLHTRYRVNDLEKTVKFYCEVLGLSKLREKVEKELIKTHLRPLQAPVGVSPVLKCWMEVS